VIANYPQPREMAICETYALAPPNHDSSYVFFRNERWCVKRTSDPNGWLGPVLFLYEAEGGYDVFAPFPSWVELNLFMEKYDLVVF